VARVLSQLKNPAYAGAFVYGRTRTIRTGPSPIDKNLKRLPKEEWKFVVKDKYPAYITWETFEKIQGMLTDNYAEYDRKKTRGIPRQGSALLHGLMYCGECGHKMVVQYKKGTRYICNYLRQQHGCQVCQYLPADAIDKEIVNQFFKALSPIELNAYRDALEKQREATDDRQKARNLQLERLQYQAQLAERQFKKVDPDNRLVAAELEKRWEQALRELKEAEKNVPLIKQPALDGLSPELKNAFLNIGKMLPDIWANETLSQQHRKAFLRCLIDKVIAHRVNQSTLCIRIVWQGNETSTLNIDVAVGSLNRLHQAEALTRAIIEMANLGKTDKDIAAQLSEQNYRSPMDKNRVLPNTVKTIRLQHGIMITPRQSHPRRIPGFLTVPQVAKRVKVTPHWLYDRLHNGTIHLNKDADKGLYLFPDRPQVTEQLQLLKTGHLKHLNLSEEHQDV